MRRINRDDLLKLCYEQFKSDPTQPCKYTPKSGDDFAATIGILTDLIESEYVIALSRNITANSIDIINDNTLFFEITPEGVDYVESLETVV